MPFHPNRCSRRLITYFSLPFTDLVSCFCPCITYGRIKRRYDHLNSAGTPDTEQGEICNSDCMLNGCLHVTCRASVILEVGHPFLHPCLCRGAHSLYLSLCFAGPSRSDIISREDLLRTAVSHTGVHHASSPRNLVRSNSKKILTVAHTKRCSLCMDFRCVHGSLKARIYCWSITFGIVYP